MLPRDRLTETEFEELDQFLLNVEGVDASMDISMLDGFFAAIVSGPGTILPSEWLRWVWDTEKGEESPVYESMEQAQRIMGLLMRHMNHVAATLHESSEDYEPILMENRGGDEPIPVIDEWCSGFMKGMSLDMQGWMPLSVGHPDWLTTIMLYGTEEGWELLKKKELSIDAHRELADGLADTVRRVHAHFLEQRRADPSAGAPKVARQQPVRRAEKVGRNDPCPCGSGKKYKHCHGGSRQLH